MTAATYTTTLSIRPDHPSLPGHFPGQPIVPGVILLEAVAGALRAWRNQRLAQVVEAKFIAPLLPGQIAELALNESGERVRFEIRCEGAHLARGIVRGEA
jgi:3-hydroxymyristoyl/3-hydroxydecanoyl-(acyl carrier protein) dehydratase